MTLTCYRVEDANGVGPFYHSGGVVMAYGSLPGPWIHQCYKRAHPSHLRDAIGMALGSNWRFAFYRLDDIPFMLYGDADGYLVVEYHVITYIEDPPFQLIFDPSTAIHGQSWPATDYVLPYDSARDHTVTVPIIKEPDDLPY